VRPVRESLARAGNGAPIRLRGSFCSRDFGGSHRMFLQVRPTPAETGCSGSTARRCQLGRFGPGKDGDLNLALVPRLLHELRR
jgi:hypothetical protein